MTTREEEKLRYDLCYKDPKYKMGPIRMRDAFNDIREIVKDYKPKTHVDISCGRGEVLDLMHEWGFDSIGTEVVDDLIATREDVIFAWSDDLPFEDNQFEFLTNCDAMEHYPPDLTIPALDEFFRVCSKVAYFTISNKPSANHWGEGDLHINKKPYDEWLQILSAYGEAKNRPYLRGNEISESFLVIKK